MANLKAIRTRLSSVKSTRQITSAMKMVAAAKLRKAQDRIVQLRPYAEKLHEILVGLNISLQETEVENVYSPRKGECSKVLLVVVTSNRGLCGGFNANVIRETRRIINEIYPEQMKRGDLWIMPIGKKGFDVLKKTKCNLLEEHNELFNKLTFDSTTLIADKLIKLYTSKEFDRIEIIYNQFKNAAVQRLTDEVFLPVPVIASGKEAVAPTDYIYEPYQVQIVEELIPKSLRIQFYKAILDSFVAEQGARMTAMHQATDNATDLIRELTLQYNKARQAAITNQLLEVVSGAEALKG
ncbi:MAG TPA: ATP synthase F1 subunit gamma [Bacteroidales bacterium]|nr:ATP synthase F1 subunit gamma [Bacteroidales bacterium]